MGLVTLTLQAAPKRLLVVTVTEGTRHASIPVGEQVLSELARSSGEFTLDFVRQPEGRPTDLPPHPAEVEATFHRMALNTWKHRLAETLRVLAPRRLKAYDGVIFENTTGELPVPDPDGFLQWIRDGHAFIGMHAAADTFLGWPEYQDMIGGRYVGHWGQNPVVCRNVAPGHPANAALGPTWALCDEIYRFQDYHPERVQELLVLDHAPEGGAPGHFPVSWCKDYGSGRVFYTSLGHREDLWDPAAGGNARVNSPDVARAFQAHILGGIEWALRLKAPEQHTTTHP